MIKLKSSSIERKLKSIIPNKAKKLVLTLLTSPIVGKTLKILKIKWNFFGGRFDYALVSDKEAAKIFWGVWESAEIRFSKRFALSETIIELGSSVGVTLGVLSHLRQNTKFICVEASSENFEKLSCLQKQLSASNDYILVNKAIAYGTDKVAFAFTSTTVSAITRAKILEENQIKEAYTLITDIEGAEAEIFFKDEAALDNCVRIIAELEETSSYSMDEQISKLGNIGFSLTESYGNVVVMSRN